MTDSTENGYIPNLILEMSSILLSKSSFRRKKRFTNRQFKIKKIKIKNVTYVLPHKPYI